MFYIRKLRWTRGVTVQLGRTYLILVFGWKHWQWRFGHRSPAWWICLGPLEFGRCFRASRRIRQQAELHYSSDGWWDA